MASRTISLSVDEDVLARYGEVATGQRMSVDAMLRRHMEEVTRLAERRAEARAWMAAKARENSVHDDPAAAETWRWNREDCYSGPRFDRMAKS
jgi:hypothetical protein